MVIEALKYKDTLLRFGDGISMEVPSSEKWKEAEEMAKFLNVFLDATKTFSTVRRPSSHCYMKEVWSIRSALLEEDTSSNTIMQNLSKKMQKKFDKYCKSPNLILTLACVFYPRRKVVCVELCFKDAYGEGTDLYNEKIQDVKYSLRKFYDEHEMMSCNTDQATSSQSPQVKIRILIKNKFEMRLSKFQVENCNSRQKNCELDSYLEELLVVSEDEEFDVLGWWKRNSDLFPTLARMTMDFLTVSVYSTVVSESAFNAVGRLMDQLRNSMNAETVEALVYTKD